MGQLFRREKKISTWRKIAMAMWHRPNKHPFARAAGRSVGSAMVTSVGMFGIHIGYSPIFPLSGTPLIVLVGEVQDRAMVKDGQVVIRPMLNFNVTFDHRFNGVHAGKMSRSVRRYFSAPEEFDVKSLKKTLPPPG